LRVAIIAVSLCIIMSVSFVGYSDSGGCVIFPHRPKCDTTTTSTSTFQIASYTTSSPSNSSQWLIVSSSQAPSGVNDFPEYATLSSLNQTTIGEVCESIEPSGACQSFTFVDQQGWFYDAADGLLYIHYEGGTDVTVTVF
jgi:hypothetical protein